MDFSIFEKLNKEGLLPDATLERIHHYYRSRLFSIYWETRSLLYLGVILLTSGLGILVYKNIDTIGHQVVLATIASLCTGGFVYCSKRSRGFSWKKVEAPGVLFDYILLLASLLLLTFIAYLQAQYNVFGNSYGLATFIPMVILFFCGYYFDHLGVLSLAIATLAAWMGIVVTPSRFFAANNFSDPHLITAGLVLGIFLALVSRLSEQKHLKEHFSFTYLNFALHLLFIASLAGMFHYDNYFLLWLIPLAIVSAYFVNRALKTGSFYIMLVIVVYSYIGISYAITKFSPAYELTLLYFVISGISVILLLAWLNKKLKTNDRL